MGGYTIYDEHQHEVCCVNLPGRNIILAAMVAAGVKDWTTTARAYCRECMCTDGIPRAEVLGAYEAALKHVESHPDYGKDGRRWSGGGNTRDILLEILRDHLQLLRESPSPTFSVEDDLMICDHDFVAAGPE